MKLLFVCISLFFLPSICYSYNGDDIVAETELFLRTRNICEALHLEGLLPKVKVKATCNNDIAEMVTEDNINVIHVDVKKIQQLFADNTWSDAALNYCLAHEIGHMISMNNGDPGTVKNTYSEFMEELSCDKLAGSAIALLSTELTPQILDELLPEFLKQIESSKTHPPTSARILSAKSGWYESMLYESPYQKFSSYYFDKAQKKYVINWYNEPDILSVLSYDRFLVQINSFLDNHLNFKILDFKDGSYSYLDALPKSFDIVVNGESTEWDDETYDNVYQMGNDTTLYSRASFMYKSVPGSERETTVIKSSLNGQMTTLIFGKGSKGRYLSYKDISKNFIIYEFAR